MPTKEEKLAENHTRARIARNQWSQMGYVDEEFQIRRLVAAGEEVPERLLNPKRGVKPQANVNEAGAYEPPPRSGKGSGVENWREYAALATDVDEDALGGMDRDDIIEMLETRGVIEKPEEQE